MLSPWPCRLVTLALPPRVEHGHSCRAPLPPCPIDGSHRRTLRSVPSPLPHAVRRHSCRTPPTCAIAAPLPRAQCGRSWRVPLVPPHPAPSPPLLSPRLLCPSPGSGGTDPPSTAAVGGDELSDDLSLSCIVAEER
ncbi:hypothetical protein ACP4OV_030488 [Aristida adscensionis]